MAYNVFCNRKEFKLLILIGVFFVFFSCGSNGGGSSSSSVQTGTTLQGNIKSVTVTTMQIADVSSITVSIGDLETTTDKEGKFMARNFLTGDQVIQFEGNGVSTFYDLIDIEEQETFVLRDLEINDDEVSTEYTGTWEGYGGSTKEGSHGDDLGLIMEIRANSNEISGTIKLKEGAPDKSTWIVDGSVSWNETKGRNQIEGTFWLDESDSDCASDAEFNGIFNGNTVDGIFTEINVPAGCIHDEDGDGVEDGPEEGIFHLEKQE